MKIILTVLTILVSSCNDKPCPPVSLEQSQKTIRPCKNNEIAYTGSSRSEDENVYGYLRDAPLKQAIQQFNESHICGESSNAPLTEDEVLAAVSELPTGNPSIKRAVSKIKNQGLMPKGSIFEVFGSVTVVSDISRNELKSEDIEFIKITLYLGLDENPRIEHNLEPEQVCEIRKIYYRVKKQVREASQN